MLILLSGRESLMVLAGIMADLSTEAGGEGLVGVRACWARQRWRWGQGRGCRCRRSEEWSRMEA